MWTCLRKQTLCLRQANMLALSFEGWVNMTGHQWCQSLYGVTLTVHTLRTISRCRLWLRELHWILAAWSTRFPAPVLWHAPTSPLWHQPSSVLVNLAHPTNFDTLYDFSWHLKWSAAPLGTVEHPLVSCSSLWLMPTTRNKGRQPESAARHDCISYGSYDSQIPHEDQSIKCPSIYLSITLFNQNPIILNG